MSNNSAVTVEGGEIGRAQAVRALACGLEPSVRFNPVLLKPGSGHQLAGGRAREGGRHAGVLPRTVLPGRPVVYFGLVACRVRRRGCEGAGSPAEINLRAGDIANMGLATAADLSVLVVGDIDRGGVLAHLFGTLARRTAWSAARRHRWTSSGFGSRSCGCHASRTRRTPACEPGVAVRFVTEPSRLADADLVVLPGSKSSVDLEWLRAKGLADALTTLGKPVLGICGGFQMLGARVVGDVESGRGEVAGPGMLDLDVAFAREKTLARPTGVAFGEPVAGTTGTACSTTTRSAGGCWVGGGARGGAPASPPRRTPTSPRHVPPGWICSATSSRTVWPRRAVVADSEGCPGRIAEPVARWHRLNARRPYQNAIRRIAGDIGSRTTPYDLRHVIVIVP